jgi:hypothetical protein
MKKSLAFGACLVAALALNTQAQNLLVDPTFTETSFDQPNPIPIPGGVNGGWAGFGATLTGANSVNLADNTWNPSGVYQILTATPGADYTASAWFNNTGAPTGAGWGTPYIINVNFDDITGTEIGTGISTGWTPETLNVPEQLTISGIAPAGTAYVLVYLMAMDNGANGTDYSVANASLTTVPEPTTLALLGLGVVGGMIWRRRQ